MNRRETSDASLSEEFRDLLREKLNDAFIGEFGSLDGLKKRLGKRLLELSAKEDEYLELVGAQGWPRQKLRRKLDEVEHERRPDAGRAGR